MAAAAVAALLAAYSAEGPAPPVRDCRTSAYGDLGQGWQRRAVVAGPVAFVGLRQGYRSVPRASPRTAARVKVLVVVEPRAVVTLSIAARSQRLASLAYARPGLPDPPNPLSAGSTSVRFRACAHANSGERWNRGTQFPGYFLLAGRGCVGVEVRARGRQGVLRRTLRFGVTRCAS
ncbi:MAG: hypothetical protein ABR521_13355 [Gaiellaceae bacterium]